MNYLTVKNSFIIFLFTVIFCLGLLELNASEHDSLMRLFYLEKTTDVDKMKIALKLSSLFQQKDLSKSMDYAHKALVFSRKVRNEKGEAMAFNMIAIAYTLSGNYDSASYYYSKALDVFQNIADSTGLMHVFNNLAVLQKKKGNYDIAVKYYKSALSVAQSKKDTAGMIQALNNLGIIMYDWKHYSTSVEFYDEALSLLKKKKDYYRIAVVYDNMGEVFMAMGDKNNALRSYKEAWKISKKGKWISTWVKASLNLGKYFSENKDFKKASEYFKMALLTSDSVNYIQGKVLSLMGLAEAYFQQGEKLKALEFINRGTLLSDSMALPDLQLQAYEIQRRIYEALADYKNAYKVFVKYSALRDTLFNQNSRKEISLLRTQYETDKKEQEIKILEKEKDIQNLKNKKYKEVFYLTVGLLVMVFLVVLGFVERRIHRQKLLREQLQREKSALEGRLFRAQMNPHFIFNALNSIAGYIENRNNEKAIGYLHDFAQLMRFNLNSSLKEYISLEEEGEALQTYIRLEQLRFGFDYNVLFLNVEDASSVFLPPMMVQPFVENAIVHGLSRMNDGRYLKVQYEVKNDFIEVEVQDNGIGYSIAQQEKKAQGDKHTSVAMQLTLERLDYYGRILNKKFSFEIQDVVENSGKICGTRVFIKLPGYVEF